MPHPDHDAVAAEVRGWFRNSAPEIGYLVEQRSFGAVSELGPTERRVILDLHSPEEVGPVLAEVAGAKGVTIWVDDRERDRLVGPALEAGGCRKTTATTHLALVGRVRGEPGPPGLVLEPVVAERLDEWSRVKLMCFGDTEEEPLPERLAADVEQRQGETALAAHHLALLEGEPVGVVGYYEGPDRLVFNLGTRLPFRGRGIAQAVLALWAESCEVAGCRSAMINATQGGRPEVLYRRLGFDDEVYWYQTYLLAPRQVEA